MKFIFLLAVLHFSPLLPAQESIIANTRGAGKVYLGIDNPLNVFVEGYSCTSLSVSTDNGTLEKTGCFYNYHPSRLGTATFTIYKRQNGKTIKVNTRNLYVSRMPKPTAQVGPYESGSNVPKGGFCAQQGLAALAPNGFGDLTFKVVSFSLIIMRDSSIQLSTRIIGNYFTTKIYEACKAMQPGSVVLITNILAIGPERRDIKLEPLEYLII
jgi:hypothetical protein